MRIFAGISDNPYQLLLAIQEGTTSPRDYMLLVKYYFDFIIDREDDLNIFMFVVNDGGS